MELSDIQKLQPSRHPLEPSEPESFDFKEQMGAEDSSDDLDKVKQPADVKGASSVKTQKQKKRTKAQLRRALILTAAANIDALSDADLQRVGQALIS